MNVLLINHTFRPTDGQGRVNLRLAEYLANRGHRLTLVGRDVPASLAGRENVTWLDTRPWPLPTTAARHVTFAVKVARLIRRLRPTHDLVIVNGGMTFPAADVNICHFVHSSWITSPHHSFRARGEAKGCYQYGYSRLSVMWERNAYRKARRVVAVSQLVKDQLVADCGVPVEKIEVIHNGLDPLPDGSQEGAKARLRKLGRLPDGALVVFFAGELKTPRKNLDVLLRAMKRLPADVHLVAVGVTDGGPYPALVRSMALDGRVHLLGHRDDVRTLYAGADCFAFFSHYDPFALVVTEAMAAGLPVITARTVGASEVVEAAGCGVVLEDSADDEAVAREILRLRDGTAHQTRLAANAREAGAELAWEVVCQRYEAVLENLVPPARDLAAAPALA